MIYPPRSIFNRFLTGSPAAAGIGPDRSQDPARYDGLAFGNISCRAPAGFVISGTQTGATAHYCPATWPGSKNLTSTTTASRQAALHTPSSEAMTHGQIYRELPAVNAVVHVHSPLIWRHAERSG